MNDVAGPWLVVTLASSDFDIVALCSSGLRMRAVTGYPEFALSVRVGRRRIEPN